MDFIENNTLAAWRSLTGRHWQLRDCPDHRVHALMRQLQLPEMIARILVARGVEEQDAAGFLQPVLKHAMPDPSHLLDMDVACGRIASAIMANERIGIFGDYDVDGATSSALLMRYIRALGQAPLVHIPDRMREGYGPNAPALLDLMRRGAGLVITVDCGTLAFEPLEAAHTAGLDVIVVDHHMGEARKPKCYALVNPNRLDETSPHGQLAAVGVAFLLIVGINRTLRRAGWFTTRKEPDVRQWLDIVALGTICDVVPLTGVNRALVSQGLKLLTARNNCGVNALLESAGVEERAGIYHAGFVLGPRINAGGRVGKADLGVRLLTTDNREEAAKLAQELEQYNAERKAIEAMVQEEAMIQAEYADPHGAAIVVAGRGWHPGVIGIVAGRLKERFHKPVAVIALLEDGTGKASARSVSGIDFGAAVIAACDAGLLLGGGGHAMAAGFSIDAARIPAFTAFLEQRFQQQAGAIAQGRRLMLDTMLSMSGITVEFAQGLEQLGPFGQGNPHIRLAVRRAVNLKPEIVGGQHIKTLLTCRVSNSRLSAIAFRATQTPLGEALFATRGQEIHVAGQLRIQEWLGKPQLSLTIEDIAAGE